MLKTSAGKTFAILFIFILAARLYGQGPSPADPDSPDSSQSGTDTETGSERWNLFYQATSIGDYHGKFNSPYEGPLSLQDYPERDVSLTTTLFFTWRLEQDTFLIFNPEIAGGKGFSGVDGIANQPNGEIPRVASATPKPYIARLLIQHDFGFGPAKEHQESDENQLAGDRPVNRYSIYAGRFTVTDYFDNNNYTHDPRMQFMAWGVMYNGAWDYPADTRGYTWGIVQEANTRNWSFRYGIVAEPKVANGQQFDRRLFRDHGQVWEAERRYELRKRAGAIRVLAYDNREQGGNYAQALALATTNGNHAQRQPNGSCRHVEIRHGYQFRPGDYKRPRDVHSPRMERRQDPELRVHGHRPPGEWRGLSKRHTLEEKGRRGRDFIYGRRTVRRAPRISGGRRNGFSDRRWRAELRAGVRLGELLSGSPDARLLRGF